MFGTFNPGAPDDDWLQQQITAHQAMQSGQPAPLAQPAPQSLGGLLDAQPVAGAAFDPYASVQEQHYFGSPEAGDRGINPATTAANYASLLDRDQLKALGAPPSFVSTSTGQGESADPISSLNPDFTKWAIDNQMSLHGDWGQNSNDAWLTDRNGKTVVSGSLGGDDTFWAAAMLAAAGVGAGAYGAGGGAGAAGTSASAGSGALGIEGATYAMPGAESGYGLANVGADAAAPTAFNAAADSQAASAAAGYNPATMATGIPSTVNLGTLGGTMGTAGGMQGAFDVAKQAGGDMLGSASSTASDAATWMKQNPMLARLLMTGAGGLLGGAGGQSGSAAGAGAQSYGPAKQWTAPSSVDVSLLAPAQRQQPMGLLDMSGHPNSGAWRFAKRG